MLMGMTVVRILREDVEQVLSFVVLLLHNSVICCLRDQSQEELELGFVKGILHCQHVIIAVVENQVRNTLLTSLNGDSEC